MTMQEFNHQIFFSLAFSFISREAVQWQKEGKKEKKINPKSPPEREYHFDAFGCVFYLQCLQLYQILMWCIQIVSHEEGQT